MQHTLAVIIALLINTRVGSTQNLVPNASFEEHSLCPEATTQFNNYVNDWTLPTYGSSDYFNTCANGTVGVPSNQFGYQMPRTGDAYAGMDLIDDIPPSSSDYNYREYIQAMLTGALELDSTYCVSFFLSRAGKLSNAATSNIGAYFSAEQIGDFDWDTLTYTPQVSNNVSNILTDTLGWMHVSGQFTAIGGEQYITIGNFLPNSQTVFVDTVPAQFDGAYYYIDDVTVTKCSQVTSVNALADTTPPLRVYPNPASTEITVKFSNKNAVLQIVDAVGRVLKTIDTNSHRAVIDVSVFPNGI